MWGQPPSAVRRAMLDDFCLGSEVETGIGPAVRRTAGGGCPYIALPRAIRQLV
jgi:hypothetical protein